jgi:hypothetical protein
LRIGIKNTNLDIRNWIRNIEMHASEGVNKILIGNKCDVLDKKVCFPFLMYKYVRYIESGCHKGTGTGPCR